jgi:predicted Rossmann fold nucleotide-binding protein DprA/Smf involved in DNA uptake
MKIDFTDFPKKVAIVGSRSFAKREDLTTVPRMKYIISRLMSNLPRDTIIISGHALGVDLWAEREAQKVGMDTVIFDPKDEDLPYIPACFARNTKIANSAEILIALVDEDSMRGTQNTIDKAKKRGIPTIVLFFSEDGRYRRMESTWKTK